MLILALDTTTRAGSCALLRSERIVVEQAGDPSRDQAERLPADLAALLGGAGVPLAAVDAFAVATGPGSFTGLRVGIATMQGLAFATNRPLVGVSAFDALCLLAQGGLPEAEWPHRLAVWIDAWRGEVFAAVYERGAPVRQPTAARPNALLAELAGPVVFTGDGAALHEAQIRRALPGAWFTSPMAPPLGAAVGRLAGRALAQGHRPPPHAVRPIYIRRSDAELARDRQ